MPHDGHPEENAQTMIASAALAVETDPTNFEALMALGLAYFEAEQFDEALATFQQASTLDPNAADAYNWIGRVYERQGPAQAAREAYEQAIALDREGIAPYIGLGILHFDQLHDYEAAIDTFQTGLEHHPDDAFAHALLGITFARMGRFAEATVSLQRAISLEPDNTFAYSNLSIIYLHLKQYDKMIVACQRQIEIADGHDARRLLGFVYDRLGRQNKAIDQLERSIALEPDDYEARGALARVYRTVGRQREADEQSALAREMADQDNEYGQACFAAVTGNVTEALTLLEVALTAGQVQPGWARIDPEFAFMADEPGFKALVDRASS